MPPDRDLLHGRLLALIERGADVPLPAPEFDELARDVFAYQFENNPIYRGYCAARGTTPDSIEEWVQIPALPADAFKAAPLLCGDTGSATTIFRTSGTTQGGDRRGAHYFRDTGLYEAALLASFSAHLVPDGGQPRIFSLVPSRGEAPDSSLSFMISEVMESFGDEGSRFFFRDGELRVNSFLDAAVTATDEGAPVLVAGTSIAFLALLEEIESRGESLALPAGSSVMDTGGFKGRTRTVPRSELYERITRLLGVPLASIINEYGMTELSSQLYDGVAGEGSELAARRYVGPGWMRTIAVDPETLEPLRAGEVGILRHLDLANLDSVAAVQTADLGSVAAEGIELLGRASGAEARGCSLAMDDLRSVIEIRS